MSTIATVKVLEKQGDLCTPIQLLDVIEGEKKFLLESSFIHETKGKYSFIGANPIQEITGLEGQTTVMDCRNGEITQHSLDALAYMKNFFPPVECDLPFPFYGGAVGYIAYDYAHTMFNIEPTHPDDLQMPDLHLMIYDTVIVYEHRTERMYLVAIRLSGESEAQLTDRLQKLSAQCNRPSSMTDQPNSSLQFQPQTTKAQFIEAVEKVQDALETEQLQQVVLSQRFVADMIGDPLSFYRNLRMSNPSPYMFYIDFDAYLLVGASPESLIEITGRQVRTNPIAGTRPRGKHPQDDERIQSILCSDQKEIDEHEMLVQLSQSDLQEICLQESISTPVYQQLELYEYVMHLVSEVHGTLREEKTSFDALNACFPAGTVSGSPRKQAMLLIQSLEQTKRGVYAGGVGYINVNEDIHFAIAIRSLVIKNEKAYVQAGAGITAQSIPEKEYEETLHKARAITNVRRTPQLT